METVRGIGGVFFKARDPLGLARWYRDTLGIPVNDDGYATFEWGEAGSNESGSITWALFPDDTTYFAPSDKPYMLNYRVDDLDAMLAQLRAAGAAVDERIEEYEYGRFGWVMDPEGNRIELWEPPNS